MSSRSSWGRVSIDNHRVFTAAAPLGEVRRHGPLAQARQRDPRPAEAACLPEASGVLRPKLTWTLTEINL